MPGRGEGQGSWWILLLIHMVLINKVKEVPEIRTSFVDKRNSIFRINGEIK